MNLLFTKRFIVITRMVYFVRRARLIQEFLWNIEKRGIFLYALIYNYHPNNESIHIRELNGQIIGMLERPERILARGLNHLAIKQEINAIEEPF